MVIKFKPTSLYYGNTLVNSNIRTCVTQLDSETDVKNAAVESVMAYQSARLVALPVKFL